MPTEDPMVLLPDSPIRREVDDFFGRRRLARRIASEARLAPSDAGFVIALCGDWGAGKTSVINLAVAALEKDATVLAFNPWLRSGTEDLVAGYFAALAGALGRRGYAGRQIATKIARYAGAFDSVAKVVPGAGSIGAGGAALEKVLKAWSEAPSLEQSREELRTALLEFGQRIVVVIDDVDRLTDSEVFDVVRLVKLVGDLPNVSYVLAFDRLRVEEVLGRPASGREGRLRGRNYLEKIVQAQHDLPAIRQAELGAYFAGGVRQLLDVYVDASGSGGDALARMLNIGVYPLLRTPRDAARVINALPASLELNKDEVAPVDLVGLEALRILEPDVHRVLPQAAATLVGGVRPYIMSEDERAGLEDADIRTLLESAHRPAQVKALLGELFPAARRPLGLQEQGRTDLSAERQAKRVAASNVFRRYVYGTLDSDTLDAGTVTAMRARLNDPEALSTALDDLEDNLLPDLLSSIADHVQDVDAATAKDIAAVFLGLADRLPRGVTSPLSGIEPVAYRWRGVISRVLLQQPTDQQRESVLALIDQAASLTERLRLIGWFGTFEDLEANDNATGLLNAELTQQELDKLRELVAAATPEQMAGEREPMRLLEGLLHPDPDAGRVIVQAQARDDQVMLAILVDAAWTQARQTFGDPLVRSWRDSNWRRVIELLESEYAHRRLAELLEGQENGQLDLSENQAEALWLARRRVEQPPDVE